MADTQTTGAETTGAETTGAETTGAETANVNVGKVLLQDATTAATKPVHLYILVPVFGCLMCIEFMTSLLQLQAACMQKGIQISVDLIGNESLITRARCIGTARFLLSSATHLMQIDSDIGFSPEAVFRLLEHDKDVVSAIYPKKSYDWEEARNKLLQGTEEPIMQLGLDFNTNLVGGTTHITNGLAQVLDVATGFLMLKRGVIERMNDHYRETLLCRNDIINTAKQVPEYVALWDTMIDENRRYLSEDYAFMRRAQALGIPVWADLATPLAHIGNQVFGGDIRQRFALSYVA